MFGKLSRTLRQGFVEGGFGLLIWRLFVVTALLFISRFLFYLFNSSTFPPLGFWASTGLFINGLRFDLATVLIINFPFVVFHILPFRGRTRPFPRRIMRWFFYLINGFALMANAGDMIYFRFSSTRVNAEIFSYIGTGGDFAHLLPAYIRDFWQVVLFSALFIAIMIRFYYPAKAAKEKSRENQEWKLQPALLLWTIILFILLVIGSRGGLQRRPITVITAAKYAGAQFTPLVINTPFSIIKTFGKGSIEQENYFDDETELSNWFNPVHLFSKKNADTIFRPDNVVIIIMESFSAEYSAVLSPHLYKTPGDGYMPFLDSLMGHSLNFTNAYANATRSIEALPAVVASLPHLMNTSFILSEFVGNSIHSLPLELRNKGYSSQFFHSGTNGTMGFDVFAEVAEFDAYYGRREYNNEADFDGYWGIFDGPFLQYVAGVLDEKPQPFFSTIFTLSSHHPYSIPANLKAQIPEGDLPIHRAVRYADYALKKFFETASNMPWYENTLFVITADHTSLSKHVENQSRTGIYRVPLLFFRPGKTWQAVDTQLTAQHADIMPSVLDYLRYNCDFLAFGVSLFDPMADRKAFHLLDNIYQVTEGDYTLHFAANEVLGLYNYRTDPLQMINLLMHDPLKAEILSNRMKAIIQTFNNRMLHNQLKINQACQ
ncbi:MAG: sulfatase-like hydrolase/transferase [Bacteroidales bacterium]|nr:sulfatase-like hydrolase/transferase [Bacteroidales bacterium]